MIKSEKPLPLHMLFTNGEGKVAHCPRVFRSLDGGMGSCGGEIAYRDEPGVENAKRFLFCLKCGRLYAQIEITECNLTVWS